MNAKKHAGTHRQDQEQSQKRECLLPRAMDGMGNTSETRTKLDRGRTRGGSI